MSLASAKPVELWLGGKLFSGCVASFKLPAISIGGEGGHFKIERHWKAFVGILVFHRSYPHQLSQLTPLPTMSISPIITFKAGQCELDERTKKVKPLPTPGYIYLYNEDELIHFCWRPRHAPLDTAELDLIMFPSDGSFTPYEPISADNPSNPKNPTNGRIYVLKFSSSSQRHLFWLQSKSQHPGGNANYFSTRDLKLGQIVNTLLSGETIDVQQAITNLPTDQNGGNGDDDEPMDDVEGQNHDPDYHRGGSGGAGPGATGADFREEGEQPREGGADGGRA